MTIFARFRQPALIDAANTEPMPDTGGLRCRSFSHGDRTIRFWYFFFPEVSTIYFALAETEPMDEVLTEMDKALLREQLRRSRRNCVRPGKFNPPIMKEVINVIEKGVFYVWQEAAAGRRITKKSSGIP